MGTHMSRLERYLLRHLLAGVLTVALVMAALMIFVNLLGQIENLDDTRFGPLQLFAYVSLRLPAFLFQTLPVAALLGALLGLGSLAVQRELIAMQALGLPMWRMLRVVLLASLMIGAGAWALGDGLAPPAEAMARQMRDAQRLAGRVARVADQVWLRDANTFVRIDRLVNARLLRGVEILEFADDGALTQVVRAPRAVVEPDGWLLFDAQGTRFNPDGASDFRQPQGVWPLRIEPHLVEVLAVRAETLTLRELWQQKQFLSDNGLESEPFGTLFWARLVVPVSILPMLLLALPLILGSLRDSSMVRRVIVGVLIGAAYYLTNLTFSGGGVVLGLPNWVSAWLPTLALGLFAGLQLRRTRG